MVLTFSHFNIATLSHCVIFKMYLVDMQRIAMITYINIKCEKSIKQSCADKSKIVIFTMIKICLINFPKATKCSQMHQILLQM